MRLKTINMERCIGCYSCMLACSRFMYKSLSVTKAALRVRTHGGLEGGFAVIVCRSCKNSPCARACKPKALIPRPMGGVTLKKRFCNGCGECVKACLINVIVMDEESNLPVICAHCGYCVKFCPHNILTLTKEEA